MSRRSGITARFFRNSATASLVVGAAAALGVSVAACSEDSGSGSQIDLGDGSGNKPNTPPPGSGTGAGGASAGGAGPGISIGDGTPGGASGSPGAGGVCNAESREGQRVPIDMYFLVDSSRSMEKGVQGGTRWDAVSGALTAFLNDPVNSDIGMGIGYFPIIKDAPTDCQPGDPDCVCLFDILCFPVSNEGGSCTPADYAMPTVPLALPTNPTAIVSDLSAHPTNGGTPTRPALEGAVTYMSSWAAMHPERKPVIVLATDGEPTECQQNTPQDVASVAATALAGAISIQTFVIGVGGMLDSLNLVAAAGGTEKAFLVEDANAATAFKEALEKIRGAASPCDFLIPVKGSEGSIDPEKVNVKYTPTGTTTPTLVPKTADGQAASCGPDGGWFYDDPAAPKTIKLCPTTCDSLSGGSVQVEFGCQTIVQPPR